MSGTRTRTGPTSASAPTPSTRRLCDAAARIAGDLGWSVAVDRPFSGAIVPLAHYQRDPRVASVMVEVNRRLYMDELTGRRLPGFAGARARLQDLLRSLVAACC